MLLNPPDIHVKASPEINLLHKHKVETERLLTHAHVVVKVLLVPVLAWLQTHRLISIVVFVLQNKHLAKIINHFDLSGFSLPHRVESLHLRNFAFINAVHRVRVNNSHSLVVAVDRHQPWILLKRADSLRLG